MIGVLLVVSWNVGTITEAIYEHPIKVRVIAASIVTYATAIAAILTVVIAELGAAEHVARRGSFSAGAAEFITDDVTRVDFSERPFRVWIGDDEYRARAVIIATGATARQLGLGPCLRLGRGEDASNGRERESNLGQRRLSRTNGRS